VIDGLDAGGIGLVAVIFLLAGMVKGTVGIGLPTAAVGMSAQLLDPRLAVALMVFPSLISNAWQLHRAGGALAALRRYAVFLVALMTVIAAVSATLTAAVPVATLLLILGVVVVLFAVTSLALAPPRLPKRLDRVGQLAAGATSGLLGGLTAIWAPPMVIYLTARGVGKQEFVRASGLIIFCGTIPLILGFWHSGIVTGPRAALSLALALPVLAGFTLGERLRGRIGTERFRRLVLIVFLLLGLNLIRRALG